MRLFAATLLLLAACAPDEDPGVDTAADTDADSDTDTDADSDTDTDTDTDTDSDTDADTDTDTADPDAVYLSSDDAGSDGDCDAVEPICADGRCALDVALTIVTVSGAFPGSGWSLRFADPRVDIGAYNRLDGSGYGLSTPFGSSSVWPTGDTYEMRVFAGAYDVSLNRGYLGGSVSAHFPLATGLTIDADTVFDVAPAFRVVAGTVTSGGVLFPGNGYVHFEDPATGAYAEVWSHAGSFDAELPDGVWEARFEPFGDDDEIAAAGLATGMYPLGTVEVAGADVLVDLAIEAWPVSGSVLVDGVPLDVYDPWAVWGIRWIGEDGEEWGSVVGSPTDWSVDTMLPPGTYKAVVYGSLVGRDIVVAEPTTVALDTESIAVTGTFRVEGAAPPDDWRLDLVDPEVDVTYPVWDEAWSRTMHAGVYDAYVQIADETHSVYVRVAEGVVVAADTALDFDIDVARLSGPVAWNGASMAGDWKLTLVDAAGVVSRVFRTGPGLSVTLPVGAYDLYVAKTASSVDLHAAVARGFRLEDDTDVHIDVTTHPIDGTVSIDGATPEWWGLFTHDEAAGDTPHDSITSGPGTFTVQRPAGAWTLLGGFMPLEDDVAYSVPLGVCVGVEASAPAE